MTNQLAKRMAQIAPFYVMDVLARAQELEAAGQDVIHMEVGEPDFHTLEPIVAAGQQALADGLTHYTAAIGIRALREKLTDYYQSRYGVTVQVDNIAITPGASGALQLALAAIVNPGDGVLIADPGYPCNRHMAALLGGEIQPVPVEAGSQYQLTRELVETHWQSNSRVVMMASPSNPTGTLIDPDELRAIHEFVSEQGGWLIVDEIYHGLTYGKQPATAWGLGDDNVIVINSFSKYFGMTGWRVGWMVVPELLLDAVDRLAQNLFLAPPTIAQYAAITALSDEVRPLLDDRCQEFQQRRDVLLPALKKLGFEISCDPQGAFYVYAGLGGLAGDGMQFSQDLLEQTGVAITPGMDFGVNAAKQSVRFAYTTDIERLKEAISRIESFLKT